MKTVIYLGQEFEVGSHMCFIAADSASGDVYAFSEQPHYDGDTWWAPGGDIECVGKVLYQFPCEAC